MIATIAELLFSAIAAIIWKPGLTLQDYVSKNVCDGNVKVLYASAEKCFLLVYLNSSLPS